MNRREPISSQNPMRVCFFIPSFSDGGAQRQCIALLNELQERSDIQLTLVTLRPGIYDHLLKPGDITWIKLGSRSGFDPRTIIDLYMITRRQRCDILITWLKASDAIGGIVRMFSPRLKWVMTERSAWYRRTVRNSLRLWIGTRADLILANSIAGRDFWIAEGARGEARTVENIVRREPDAPSKEHPAVIVSVGRQVANKNVVPLARALCSAVLQHADARGQILGQGVLESEVREVISDSGASRVEFVGFRDDAVSFIARAKVFLSLSGLEGKPNALLEAVAHDTVPVLSDIPEHVEIVGADYPYLVSADQSPEEIATVILDAIEHGEPEVHLATARSRTRNTSPVEVGDAYMEEFEALLRRAGRGRSSR